MFSVNANAAADRPMVLTATGYVPIEANAGGKRTKAEAQDAVASLRANDQTAPPVQKYDPDQPRVPVGQPGAGQWTMTNKALAAYPELNAEIEASIAKDGQYR